MEFLIVQDMNHQELIFFGRQLLEGGAPAARIEQIAHDDNEPGMGKKVGKRVNSRSQIGLAAARQLAEKAKQTENLLPSPSQCKRNLQSGRK